jgi:hypothetical protein
MDRRATTGVLHLCDSVRMRERRKQGFEVLLWRSSADLVNATPGIGTLFFEWDDLRKDFADLKARGVQVPRAYTGGLSVRHALSSATTAVLWR